MSNYDFSYLTTRELLEKALNGELPIPRNNPKVGDTKYFFMKTGDDPYASINDAEVFDVPDDEDPFEFRDNGYQSSALNSNTNDFKNVSASVNNMLNPLGQMLGASWDMGNEYFKMKNHNYIGLDDYHHCKANYNASMRGNLGSHTAKIFGDLKEYIDYFKNIWNKGLTTEEALQDLLHDSSVNQTGIERARLGIFQNAQEACSDYRKKNPSFPKKYW